MEPRARRQRSHATPTPPPGIRVEPVRTRRNGRDGHARTAAAHGDAFPVRNVVVSSDRSEQPPPTVPDPPVSAAGEAERVSPVQQACERLAARNSEVQALIGRIERFRYERMIVRIRQVLDRQLPARATVAVISRGDEKLVTVSGRRAWHFPQTPKGVYAGHHPADSHAAIVHLEQVRARGARYLLIPRTAFWWLDHYRDLADHLQRSATCVFRDDHTCALFALGAVRKAK
jgi:hypothetical protein